MVQTAGIIIEHNAKGIPTFARIDLKKYGVELKDFFSSKGIFEYENSKQGLDEAMEDVKNNRVYQAENAKDLINQCLSFFF
jgi:hypothetical protein